MNNASTHVTLGILSLALVVASAAPAVVYLTAPRATRLRDTAMVAGIVITWLTISGALAASGFFRQWTSLPPRALLIILPTVALPLWLGLSRLGKTLADRIPTFALIGLQSFRLPLELVMHQAATEGTMPEQMSFGGFNFDIATGILAVAILTLYWRREVPRTVARAFAIVGTFLLVIVVSIALASLPMFAAFGSEPSQLNTWVGDFPFVWLPGALVASALLFHVVLWRRLATQHKSTA